MRKSRNGFTLIEVIIVLAIAGAIFAAVFIALQGVLADERDAQRREDVLTFVKQLKNYQTNNSRGALPTLKGGSYPLIIDGSVISKERKDKTLGDDWNNTWQVFYRDYFKDTFDDPDGVYYDLKISECAGALENNCVDKNGNTLKLESGYTINVVIGASCSGYDGGMDGVGSVIKSANSRNVAVLYDLEAGGFYCENT